MSTTTIRPSEALKARVAAAAEGAGKSTHSFILEAIAEKTEQEERADFDELADARFSAILATGKAIPWTEVRSYLEARVAGKAVRRPSARKLGR
jgi:predicted transcriptional regulator